MSLPTRPEFGLTHQEFECLVRAAAWIGLDKHSVWPQLRELLVPTLPPMVGERLLRLTPEELRRLCAILAERQRQDRETPTKEHVVPESLRPHHPALGKSVGRR